MADTDDDQRWYGFVDYNAPERRREEHVFDSYAQARDWHDQATRDLDGVAASGLLPEAMRAQSRTLLQRAGHRALSKLRPG